MIYYTGVINSKAKVWHFQTWVQVLEFLEAYNAHKDFDTIHEVDEATAKVLYNVIHKI